MEPVDVPEFLYIRYISISNVGGRQAGKSPTAGATLMRLSTSVMVSPTKYSPLLPHLWTTESLAMIPFFCDKLLPLPQSVGPFGNKTQCSPTGGDRILSSRRNSKISPFIPPADSWLSSEFSTQVLLRSAVRNMEPFYKM